MELAIYFLFFITASLLFFIAGQLIFSRKQLVGERMESIKSMYSISDEEDEMRKPFVERVVNPAYQKIVTILGNITPNEIKKKYEKIIMQAGVGKTLSPSSLISIQVMLSLVLGGVLYLLYSLIGSKSNILLIFIFMIIGFYLPYTVLNTNSIKRQRLIQKTLPDLLDLLYISVEAGLGFDMALKKAAEKMPGPLSDEINKAMDDIAKGRDRQEALRGLVRRTGVDDLNTFITAVIQSEQLGTNISSMLRVQSTVMRQKRRQRAEEIAMKIPLKMLFPLVFLLFPALFVVILGPAVLNIIETLGNMN